MPCRLARPAVRLGRRRPLLRAQRLPRRAVWSSREQARTGPLRRPPVHRPAPAQAVAGALRLPRRAGARRPGAAGRAISGRTPFTCRTTPGTSLSHLWSLAVEEHFYLALAVLFPLFARRQRSPRSCWPAILVGRPGAALLVLRVLGAAAARERRRGCSGAPTSGSTRSRPASCSPWSACTAPAPFDRLHAAALAARRPCSARRRRLPGRRSARTALLAGRRSASPSPT